MELEQALDSIDDDAFYKELVTVHSASEGEMYASSCLEIFCRVGIEILGDRGSTMQCQYEPLAL